MKQNIYLLGENQNELDRLAFQHKVWRHVTEAFLDQVQIQGHWQCLDVGAGPGFVSKDISERLGSEGSITLLEPSRLYVQYFDQEIRPDIECNVSMFNSTVEEQVFPKETYDFIFIRWVIAFNPDPFAFLRKLIDAMKPGGVIAIQDYYYEGLSLFPPGRQTHKIHDIVRDYYRSGGGNPYLTAEIPKLFEQLKVTIDRFDPIVLSGDHESLIFKWAHLFFKGHLPLMKAKGIINESEEKELLEDWEDHSKNKYARFFSPIVVNISGKKMC